MTRSHTRSHHAFTPHPTPRVHTRRSHADEAEDEEGSQDEEDEEDKAAAALDRRRKSNSRKKNPECFGKVISEILVASYGRPRSHPGPYDSMRIRADENRQTVRLLSSESRYTC